ncbi:MAG: hypothetical protein ACE5G6_08825 [Terriglobia bacterium]
MEETKTTKAAEAESDKPAAAGKPKVHRVCEGCNNMFAAAADSPQRRCPNCRKD